MDAVTGSAIRFVQYLQAGQDADINMIYNMLVQINNTIGIVIYMAILIILYRFLKKVFRGLSNG